MEKFCCFFSWILLKLHFEWKIYSKDGQNQGRFFPNESTFFDFQKRAEEASPSCAPAKIHSIVIYIKQPI